MDGVTGEIGPPAAPYESSSNRAQQFRNETPNCQKGFEIVALPCLQQNESKCTRICSLGEPDNDKFPVFAFGPDFGHVVDSIPVEV